MRKNKRGASNVNALQLDGTGLDEKAKEHPLLFSSLSLNASRMSLAMSDPFSVPFKAKPQQLVSIDPLKIKAFVVEAERMLEL
jgi:hypothetical protein